MCSVTTNEDGGTQGLQPSILVRHYNVRCSMAQWLIASILGLGDEELCLCVFVQDICLYRIQVVLLPLGMSHLSGIFCTLFTKCLLSGFLLISIYRWSCPLFLGVIPGTQGRYWWTTNTPVVQPQGHSVFPDVQMQPLPPQSMQMPPKGVPAL